MAKPGKKKKLLFVLEIVVLLLFIGGLYVYGQISSRLDKIEQPKLDEEKIMVNQEAPKMTGYKTYVLFGIDSRGAGSQYSAQNSDTMIIVSVNNDTKEVRMASIYRDTLLNIGDDTYTKANAAYARGSAEQAISMLNTNLDLDISDYATADFSALAEVIDDLGGLDIPMSYAELVHMNNYCAETAGTLYREKPFVMGFTGEELAAFGFGDGEKCADDKELTLIQGIIDVFWIEEDGIVVLDYKTDRVKTGKELADRYASQLKLYGEALERIYNHGSERTLRVKERLLYSFRLGAVIPV